METDEKRKTKHGLESGSSARRSGRMTTEDSLKKGVSSSEQNMYVYQVIHLNTHFSI